MQKRPDDKLRVLLVDDLADDTLMMGKLLIARGCDIATCNDPRTACEVARQFKPDLVLLDIAMPGMSGFTVAKELRAAGIPQFLLVARTGYADPETRARCEAAGFKLVLVKPVDASALANVLELARSSPSSESVAFPLCWTPCRFPVGCALVAELQLPIWVLVARTEKQAVAFTTPGAAVSFLAHQLGGDWQAYAAGDTGELFIIVAELHDRATYSLRLDPQPDANGGDELPIVDLMRLAAGSTSLTAAQ